MAGDSPELPGATPPESAPQPSHIKRVLRLWIVLSVIFVALTFIVVPLVNPTTASSVAGFASLTDLVFTALAVPVAIFVWVFVFYSVFTFREKTPVSGNAQDLPDGPPHRGQAAPPDLVARHHLGARDHHRGLGDVRLLLAGGRRSDPAARGQRHRPGVDVDLRATRRSASRATC